MSKVLSFDQSTRNSGWAYFCDNQYVKSGVIDMSKSELETNRRSFEMAKELWKVVKKYKPDYLILEDTQQQNNIKTVITLARLAGMVIGYAEAHGIKVHILLPSAWRKVLGFNQGPKVKRAELKQQSIDYIKNTLGKEMPEDEAEAICIAIAAHKIFDLKGEDEL